MEDIVNVYLYVLDTLADWEIAHINAELHSGRYFSKGHDPIRILKVALSPLPVRTMGGLEINPDMALDKVSFNNGDILILPGADRWLDDQHTAALTIAKDLLHAGVTVAAICGATIALAGSGVLNDYVHTSNDLGFLKSTCPKYTGEAYYRQVPAVADKNLITASGLSPLEFSYEVFKATHCFNDETLNAWYNLFKTKESKYYFELFNSLNES
jgi:putative intracellular protease/amidase